MPQIASRPVIYNETMTSANTEYSKTLPVGTKRFEIKLRALNALLKLAFVSGESGTNYITIPYGASYREEDVRIGSRIIYFQSPTAAMTAEIKVWIA